MGLRLRRLTFWGGFGLVTLLLLAWVILFPVLTVRHHPDRRPRFNCASNVRQLGLGLLMYAQDYDERLPHALEWSAAVMPYVRSERPLHCPDDTRFAETPAAGPRSYDMVQRWSAKALAACGDHPARYLTLYEIGDMGVAYRHNDGMNAGFVDGHSKWFPRTVLTPPVILSGEVPAAEDDNDTRTRARRPRSQ